jgi:sec-independent protein translocase protein TatB
MFDMSWSEIALIAIVALIFIGPKELPAVLRNVGKWVTAARNMAREFQGHVDDLVRETELDEIRRNIRDNTAETLNDLANHIDPDKSLRDGIDPDKLMAGETKPADATSGATPAIADAAATDPAAPLGSDFRPPEADIPPPPPGTEPAPAATATASAEPAKNAGVPEPGRA